MSSMERCPGNIMSILSAFSSVLTTVSHSLSLSILFAFDVSLLLLTLLFWVDGNLLVRHCSDLVTF